MMRWIVLAALVGCGSKSPPPFEGAMPIQFGACATTTTSFVSGPRPVPFTPYEAAGVWTAAANDDRDDPPPQSAPDPDQALAREQAIEAARSAGILGSSAITGSLDDAPPHSTDFGEHGAGVDGAGFGTKYGGGIRQPIKRAAVPTIAIGKPDVGPGLDKAIIRRFIKRHIQKIQYCYEKQLLLTPGLDGTLSTQFTIKDDGTVTAVTASGFHPKVASCVADVIKAIEFPKPQGGGSIIVKYPFTFREAGSDPTPSHNQTPPDQNIYGGLLGNDPPPPPPTKPTQPSKPTDSVFRPDTAPLPDSRHYAASLQNPLREATGPLEQCFRRNPTHVGAVVVDFTYDPAGHVIAAETHGLDDKATIDCVVAVAKQQVRATPAVTSERCGLVFGRTAITEAPGIDLDVTSKLDGKVVQMNDLETALAGPVATPIAIHGPLVMRIVPTVGMDRVYKVLDHVMKSDSDFVLAADRNNGFELFYQMELPVVPVPRGTGARWNRVKSPLSDALLDRVTLSLLVTKQGTYVGVSRVNELTIAATPDKLADALKDEKASAFFADRSDIEIAADREMTYADLTTAIDAAMKAGFTDFQITDPEGLAARPTL
jgi:hypothetical protein